MNLYLITQNVEIGYDTYDSAVVACETENEARNMHPSNGEPLTENDKYFPTWATKPEDVMVEFLGECKPNTKAGVICSSFNAG